MKKDEVAKLKLALGRRDLLKAGAGSALLTLLRGSAAFAQGTPWWDVRPPQGTAAPKLCIDIHAHWAPTEYINAVKEYGHTVEIHPFYSDLPGRIKWMDEHGAKMHVLSLDGSAPWNWVTPEQGMRLAQIVNDKAIEAQKAYPDRILATVAAPVRDPAQTLEVLNRYAGIPAFKALHLPDSIGEQDYLFEPAFAPVFARCQELGFPLIFHQVGTGVRHERTSGGPLALGAAIDAPYDHMVIATKFILSGTLDKFPKLDIILPHAGGDFPWLAARVDHFLSHYNLDRGPVVKLDHPFKDYLRRFHYDYLTYYPEGFRYLLGLVGADRIMCGTDIFAAMDIAYPSNILDQFKLPTADRDKILFGNAKRLFHLS